MTTTPEDHSGLESTEALLTATLDRQATAAPTDAALLSGVHQRLRRRRTGRVVGAAVLACAAVAVAVTAGQTLTTDVTPTPADSPRIGDVAAKAGWRWESYKTVQVQVPAKWDNYVSGPAPCPGFSGSMLGTVGRFSPWLNGRLTCGVAVLPLADRHEYLWFDDVQKPGVKQYDGGWTEETRDVNGVHISVLTRDNALRQEILDSAVKIDGLDTYGCKPSLGEPSESDEGVLGAVTSVEICEYWSGGLTPTAQKPLISGARLEGRQATAMGQALNDPKLLPAKATPPTGCGDDAGRRTYELTLRGPDGTWHRTFTYSVCEQVVGPSIFELIRTGVRKPAQPSDILDPPGTLTPPVR
jgi:hypothetical protein